MPSTSLAPDATVYYVGQSAFSDPGALADRYAGLPADPGELARIVRGLMIHRLEGDVFRYDIPETRLHNDAETRYIDDILRVLVERNGAPLTQRRWVGDRFVGICRDFALLHCSFLRHAGIPARLRIGFADYFGDGGFHGDHVVVEYWSAERGWLLADAELADPAITERHGVGFDPMDVPRDRFLVAGEAWHRIRAGELDPQRVGLELPGQNLVGEWFVAGSIRLDLAALNKREMLQWDVWGAGADHDGAMTDAIRDLYDRAASVTAPTVAFDAARALFTEDDGLRTPRMVLSLAPFNGPREVALRG